MKAKPGDRLEIFVVSGKARFFDSRGQERIMDKGQAFRFPGGKEEFAHDGEWYTDSKGGKNPYQTNYIIVIV